MNFVNCRGIIIKNNKLVVMEREFNGKKYCSFPGEHLEGNESYEECLAREVMEEFGITIKPKKMIYGYEFCGKNQCYFVADWISGEIHKTDGEEYQPNNNRGTYNPTQISFEEFDDKNLMPPEIKKQLVLDIKKYGMELNRKYIFIK